MLNDYPIKSVKLHLKNTIASLKELMVIYVYRVNFTRQNFCFVHNRNIMPILVTAVTAGQYV